MNNAQRKQIANTLIQQHETDMEAACMLARVCEKCADKNGHERHKEAAVMLEKKIAALQEEIKCLEEGKE